MNKYNICFFMISPCNSLHFFQELQFSFSGILCSPKFMMFTWASQLCMYARDNFISSCTFRLVLFLASIYKWIFISTQEPLYSNLLIERKNTTNKTKGKKCTKTNPKQKKDWWMTIPFFWIEKLRPEFGILMKKIQLLMMHSLKPVMKS